MSTLRAGQPGATRLCPHCKATVLESASICPGCRHHLRFSGGKQLAEESYTALSVDGTIAHRESADICEYCIVLDITNERGEQVMRQVVGVGALQPGERRRLNVSVQMLPLVPQAQQPRTQPASAPVSSGNGLRPPGLAAGGTPAGAPGAAARPAATGATVSPRATPGMGSPSPAPSPAGATSAGGQPRIPAPVRVSPAPAVPGSTSATVKPSATPTPTAPSPGQRLHVFRKP